MDISISRVLLPCRMGRPCKGSWGMRALEKDPAHRGYRKDSIGYYRCTYSRLPANPDDCCRALSLYRCFHVCGMAVFHRCLCAHAFGLRVQSASASVCATTLARLRRYPPQHLLPSAPVSCHIDTPRSQTMHRAIRIHAISSLRHDWTSTRGHLLRHADGGITPDAG